MIKSYLVSDKVVWLKTLAPSWARKSWALFLVQLESCSCTMDRLVTPEANTTVFLIAIPSKESWASWVRGMQWHGFKSVLTAGEIWDEKGGLVGFFPLFHVWCCDNGEVAAHQPAIRQQLRGCARSVLLIVQPCSRVVQGTSSVCHSPCPAFSEHIGRDWILPLLWWLCWARVHIRV